MSLILEALKKSEQQRRLGEAPTLGSPMIVMRRRRSLLPLFGALLVIALGVGWWLLRAPTQAPPAVVEATTPVAPAATAAPAPAVASPADARANAPLKPVATAPAAPRQPGLPLPAGDRPGSVATLPPASPLVRGPRNPPPATVAAAPPAVKPPPTAPAARAAAASANPATAAAAPIAKPAAPTMAAPARPVARPPAAPALPSVWELPYAIRKDLPELKLSLHLYAAVPRERFVVIDGERYVEGEDIAEGVTLREIRADGMVLDFNGQRFVYPRDGR